MFKWCLVQHGEWIWGQVEAAAVAQAQVVIATEI